MKDDETSLPGSVPCNPDYSLDFFKVGDFVRASCEGRTVDATIVIASPNGRSLAIQWDDGMLAGHCGMMPILQDERGEYRSLVGGFPVTLVRK